MISSRLAAAALVAGAVALAGCGGDDGAGPASAATPVNGRLAITATEFSFKPGKVTIPAGERVTIAVKNVGAVEHDLVFDEADFTLKVPAGKTASGELEVDDPGTYTWYCSISGHRDAGMEATIIVE